MSFSHYNKETGLITHFDGSGSDNIVPTVILSFVLIFFSMILSIVDEIFGPFDLPFILQYFKIAGNIALGVLYVITKAVLEWWIEIRG